MNARRILTFVNLTAMIGTEDAQSARITSRLWPLAGTGVMPLRISGSGVESAAILGNVGSPSIDWDLN